MTKFVDYYKVLQVDRHASDKIIQTIYRALAKQYHPDTNPGDPMLEKMQEVNAAYAILGNEDKRREYNKQYDIHYAPPSVQPKTSSDTIPNVVD